MPLTYVKKDGTVSVYKNNYYVKKGKRSKLKKTICKNMINELTEEEIERVISFIDTFQISNNN